ncbi:MAG: Na+/H+ antiporter NhaA [Bacteroidales bacterium]|jgi:NhaA family Na+:H+ antiporter|nr:Na+/H+ antiporter NhaA [Bacteroidales bacterium]
MEVHITSPREKGSKSLFNITSFISQEALGGLLLILVTVVALVWANSGLSGTYHHLWHDLKMGFTFGDFELRFSLQHWINDGLMAIFFFMVGLEIKREVISGELSTLRKASLPIAAAFGGMLFPALIYIAINGGTPDYRSGWGTPMATDIAFALGVMSLLGKRVNINLKIFLTALAIADDLGAIMVIALFYTETINLSLLITAGIVLTGMMIANRMGVRSTTFYASVGLLGVWLAFLFSGVHATIAGVLIALTIPGRTKITEREFVDKMCSLVDKFEKEQPNDNAMLTREQAHLVGKIARLSDDAHTPLQKLEHALHPITAWFILPLFALANAGVHLEGNILDMLFHPVSLGIMAGLVIGKVTGIALLSRLMVGLKLSVLPEGITWRHIIGAGLLAGIGFTMSIFISGLAFADESLVQIAKIGIFGASLISAVAGLLVLSSAGGKKE